MNFKKESFTPNIRFPNIYEFSVGRQNVYGKKKTKLTTLLNYGLNQRCFSVNFAKSFKTVIRRISVNGRFWLFCLTFLTLSMYLAAFWFLWWQRNYLLIFKLSFVFIIIRSVSLVNRSDLLVHFSWKTFATASEEEHSKKLYVFIYLFSYFLLTKSHM